LVPNRKDLHKTSAVGDQTAWLSTDHSSGLFRSLSPGDAGHVEPEGQSPQARTSAADPIRGEIRLTGHRRVSHGLFLPLVPGLSPEQEFLRDLRAWQLVLPDDAAFTHLTAARVLGWQLPQLPPREQVPVFTATTGDGPRPRRPGLVCSRLVRPANAAVVSGVPIDTPEEVILRAARDLGALDLTIMLDSARRLGHLSPQRVQAVLESSRPGVRMFKLAWGLSDPRSESGPETVLRIFHRALDVPVEPQAVLTDGSGRIIGCADLRILGTNDLAEYDGDVHRNKEQQRVDLRRERGLNASPYRRYGYTLDDLLNHPLTAMHEIDRRLGRPHRISRLRRWQRLVDNSLYSPRGRERILNRWRRVGGIIDWSRTA